MEYCPILLVTHYTVLPTIRAVNSAATISVAPLLFKIDSAATSAASILTTFKRCANR